MMPFWHPVFVIKLHILIFILLGHQDFFFEILRAPLYLQVVQFIFAFCGKNFNVIIQYNTRVLSEI